MVCILLFFLSAGPGHGATETVALPLRIDYPLLRALVVSQAFSEPGDSRVILDEQHGCTRIVVADPQYSSEGGNLRLDLRLSIRAGQGVADTCLTLAQWDGYLSFQQTVRIDDRSWQLTFPIRNSFIANHQQQQRPMTDLLWNLVKGHVHAYLNQISINLAPPVADLKSILQPMFAHGRESQTRAMLESLHCSNALITEDGLRCDLLMQVEGQARPVQEEALPDLQEKDLQKITERWEAWDGFLVQLISILARNPLKPEERQILLDALLDIRYRFVEELSTHTIGRDFVREQFVETWQQISPVFRNHLDHSKQHTILGYLAFFTASDALLALDRMGPSLGLEISREGLLRLLHAINEQAQIVPNGSAVNQPLRQTLGMPPLPEAGRLPSSGSNQIYEEIIIPASDPVTEASGDPPETKAEDGVPIMEETEQPASRDRSGDASPGFAPEDKPTSEAAVPPAGPLLAAPPAVENASETDVQASPEVSPDKGENPPIQEPAETTVQPGLDALRKAIRETAPDPEPARQPETRIHHDGLEENTLPPGQPADQQTGQPGPPPPAQPQPPTQSGGQDQQIREEQTRGYNPLTMLLHFLVSPACATEKQRYAPRPEEIRQWLGTRENLDKHINQVKQILDNAAMEILAKKGDGREKQDYYRNLVTATAWQESCFRQFEVKQGKITFLRSATGSAIGLMQVNEKVWQGLYDLNRLRWEIAYNIQAGTEILDLYLRQYLEKKNGADRLSEAERAGVLYAMYNGGPGQYSKYLARRNKKELYDSDRLFMEKYGFVTSKNWRELARCAP